MMRVTIADIQTRLASFKDEEGVMRYDPGPMDGHDSPRLGEAIAKFQVDKNMFATGKSTDILMLGRLFGLPVTEVHGLYSDLPAGYWDAEG